MRTHPVNAWGNRKYKFCPLEALSCYTLPMHMTYSYVLVVHHVEALILILWPYANTSKNKIGFYENCIQLVVWAIQIMLT